MPVLQIPIRLIPLLQYQMICQIELQRRDRDVSIADAGDVGVVVGRAQREYAAVPIVSLSARILALLVRIDPWTGALPSYAHARRLLVCSKRGEVDAHNLSRQETR